MEDNIETEITTSDVIQHMVDTILAGNATDATDQFKSLMSYKISDALDNKKVELSQSLYARDE